MKFTVTFLTFKQSDIYLEARTQAAVSCTPTPTPSQVGHL